eukprot:6866245-Pyramimonas_sp.AAC.1
MGLSHAVHILRGSNIEAIGRTLVRSAAKSEQVIARVEDVPDEPVIEDVEWVKEKEKQRSKQRQDAGPSPEQLREKARFLKRDGHRVRCARSLEAAGDWMHSMVWRSWLTSMER